MTKIAGSGVGSGSVSQRYGSPGSGSIPKCHRSAKLTARRSERNGRGESLSQRRTKKKRVFFFFRVPALAALLLFSHSMETTGDVSRIIFDSWLEVKFADPEAGQNQLITAVKLRHGACAQTGKQRFVSAFCRFISWPFVLE